MTDEAPLPVPAGPSGGPAFTSYQKFVVGMLAFLQFTVILDFMILSPLGAMLMRDLATPPAQFGWVVSVYAFSAGASGILAAGFSDRFDRKKFLMFFYAGFVLGTLMCGLAQTYTSLLIARMVTGLFGGVLGSVVGAITTDLFPMSMRGRVMGFVQTAFASSQVMGIPLGLFLANHWGWHAPFLLIVGVSSVVGVVIFLRLQPITQHLERKQERSAFSHLWSTLSTPRYLQAFATVALLSTGGFMLMPFGSAFSVHNLGIPIEKLPMVYMITGLCSMVTGPVVGRLSDTFGKFPMFVFGSLLSILMVFIYTHLGVTPLALVILTSSVMFIGISSRMIPSQALLSAIPAPESRGSFMAVTASVQQISGGFAAAAAGMIVHEAADGKLEHYTILGYVVMAASTFTLVMMYFIQRTVFDPVSAKH